MTPEEQRIAIAGACGWKSILQTTGYLNDAKFPDTIPRYLNDLNAIHEAEKVLDRAQQEEFGGFLYHGRICSFRDFCTGRMVFQFAHKTAAQRAEAFLRAIRKWKDQ